MDKINLTILAILIGAELILFINSPTLANVLILVIISIFMIIAFIMRVYYENEKIKWQK